MKYPLKKPITFEDQLIRELNLDLDSLTGDDLLAVERDLIETGQGSGSVMKAFSGTYLASVAARAAHQPIELIGALGAKDFLQLTMQVQRYFFDEDSTDQPDGSSEKS